MSFKKTLFAVLSLMLICGITTGCGEKGGDTQEAKEKALPELDEVRIAEDMERGIRFNGRVLVK